jgi:uncharacterized protein YceH (UPF0502 family)
MIARMRLTPEEGRVIGSLVEKQLTTPQQYPLTLNSLVLACNQSSNREPVVAYDEPVVQTALAALRTAEMVSLVYPSHGRSVTRYRHTLAERLGLDERELALVAVLLLRGPQTAGELRARTERMAQFDGIDAVDADLVRLSEKQEPLAIRLPRRPGQKEERWTQLLSGAASSPGSATDGPAPPASLAPPAPPAPPAPFTPRESTTADPAWHQAVAPPVAGDDGVADRVESLAEEVAALRAEVAALNDAFDRLRDQLGG